MVNLADLNSGQHEAVSTLAGPLLVLAGAGTGKTRVITVRMAELIKHGVSADRILSVTFTNKAAREMQERMQSLLGRRLKEKPVISTFHSYCVGVLRQEIAALGYPSHFVIYDRGDQESAARRALRDVKVPETSLKPADLVNRVSRWKSSGVGPQEAREHVEDDRDFLAASAYRKYQTQLKAAGAVDFDDLLLLTAKLFAESPEVLKRQQERFDHVQIDEYQDTNELQFRLIHGLVMGHRNLCVVGDDDQSIYGWRGAEIKHILGFSRHFPEAKVVRLEENYRCTESILTLANQLVAHNRGRHKKKLVAHKSGMAVAFKEYADELTEAESVVREIRFLVTQKQVPPSDIAILFRTNEQPRLFESELLRQQVRYHLEGAQSFFDRREVKDMQAYCRAVLNPGDEISLLRIIHKPPRGIGVTSIAKVVDSAAKGGESFWQALPKLAASGGLPPKTSEAALRFRDQLVSLRKALFAGGMRLSDWMRKLIQEVNYEAEIDRENANPEQRELRLTILGEFISSVEQYEARSAKPTLAEFLTETALAPHDQFEREIDNSCVRMMTLHSAKGLEFPRVYLVGMEEGILPHKRSIDDESPTAIEEERRLCYVGITRARDCLTLTRALARTKRGKRIESKPSRFLKEMHVPLKPVDDVVVE